MFWKKKENLSSRLSGWLKAGGSLLDALGSEPNEVRTEREAQLVCQVLDQALSVAPIENYKDSAYNLHSAVALFQQVADRPAADYLIDKGLPRLRALIRRFREQVFGSITQMVNTDPDLVGATVRFEVWIRAEGVTGKGAVVLIDSANGTSYMERVDSERITVTSNWKRVRVDMLVPTYTNNLRPSISLDGDGSIWIDDAKLTVLKRAK